MKFHLHHTRIYIRILYGITFGLGILLNVFIFFYSNKDLLLTGICTCFVLGFWIILSLLIRIQTRNLDALVSDLSDLTDSLITLDEHTVFSDTDEHLLSKLQSKVTKLVQILRKQKDGAIKDKEKIHAFVSDLSHQLKTPISNLILYTSLLQEENLPPETQTDYLHTIQNAIQRLDFLSESMIKISRLENGLIQLHPKKQSCNATALQAIKSVYTKAKSAGTEICYQEEDKEILATHDRNWTAEAIFNLLDNAVKYSCSQSKVTIHIKRYGMFAAIEVSDENTPISKEERNKIFTRFYRGKNSSNKEGIGIGLYLSREIIRKQDGYITLKTTEKGNIFLIVLPVY